MEEKLQAAECWPDGGAGGPRSPWELRGLEVRAGAFTLLCWAREEPQGTPDRWLGLCDTEGWEQ